jgi:hypothetical protein
MALNNQASGVFFPTFPSFLPGSFLAVFSS